MKIGFDARMITHPGIGRYIGCLLPEMIRQGEGHEFVLFGEPKGLGNFSLYEHVEIRKWTAPIYSVWEQAFNPLGAKDLDIVHVPHFNAPLFLKRKLVVTVHDLIYLLFPESVSSPLAKGYASYMIRSVLNKAGTVISVSEHTREDLIRLFGDAFAEKIEVVYEGPGDTFRRTEDKTRQADVRTRYRLSENIILYVGSVKPHKNVESLLDVYDILKGWGVPHQLVVCGRWDRKEDRLKSRMKGANVRYLGEVPTEDLVTLYNIADILVHLSLYEGFGLTVLEAMKCGTPVVTSGSASLPEVAGDAAFVVDPNNKEQVADTIYNVLVNKHLVEGMVDAGFDQAKKFSWKKAAARTLNIYEAVVR